MTIEGAAAARRVIPVFVDGDATGIEDVRSMMSELRGETWYTLDGQLRIDKKRDGTQGWESPIDVHHLFLSSLTFPLQIGRSSGGRHHATRGRFAVGLLIAGLPRANAARQRSGAVWCARGCDAARR